MKKLIYYAAVMLLVVIVLPMLIVKSCDSSKGGASGSKPQAAGEKILVYNTFDKEEQQMDLEEYIKGVVTAEMPVEFGLEALKAQAVAARTFAFGRMTGVYKSSAGVHDNADICTDSTHCQAWVSKASAMKRWGIFFASRNWARIERAVAETRGIIVTYDGKIANTLFHSNSGGKTENSEDVWDGVAVPYLRSVPSSGEDASKEYKTAVLLKVTDFINTIHKEYPDVKFNKENVINQVKIVEYTAGGRVKTMKVGDITIKGTDFRTLFSLRSANFKIEKADNSTLKITTLGYGHGVGMSQWGANDLAKKGGTFDEILKHYYTGVELMTTDVYKRLQTQ